MDIPPLPGVTPRTLTTARLTSRVLFAGPGDGQPVLFLHGNLSNATWWEETLVALPDSYRGIAPDQRGFGSADPTKKIDATRSMGDLADDALALLDHLGIKQAHVVGNSLGGNVVWQLMQNAPHRLGSVTLVGPGSPFGFGGTKDEQGTPCWPDFAGSGGGVFNRTLVQLIAEGDSSTDHRFSPRQALRDLVYKQPFIPPREDVIVEALLQVHTGDQDLPGDIAPSDNWPGYAPGVWGATNALSPKYAVDVERIAHSDSKPPVLWIRGADDAAVADEALGDIGTLGQMGLIKGWPSEVIFPPQPMLKQTRWLLRRYETYGGKFWEEVLDDCGHVPFIEKPDAFNAIFHAFLQEH